MDLFADLDAQLAAHECADAKELRDVAFVRAFLRAHPSDAHLRAQAAGHLTGSGFVLDASHEHVLLLHHAHLDRSPRSRALIVPAPVSAAICT